MKNKKNILIIVCSLLTATGAWIGYAELGAKNYPIDAELVALAKNIDLDASWEKQQDWKRSSMLWPSGIEYGVVSLRDGTHVKFAFRSHHSGDAIGATYFVAPGYEKQMNGWFCCEVECDDIADIASLDRFIAEHDGISP